MSEVFSRNTQQTRKGGCSDDGDTPFNHSYSQIILENLPFYLMCGMTYTQYMDEDCELAIYYRKKYLLEEERYNYHAWLQGMYVYEAVADVSPVLHAFAKRGTEILPYAKEPYPITERQQKAAAEREAARKQAEMKAKMTEFMVGFNAQHNKEGVQ
ncbi:MAG: hypothetical protein J6S85_02540 [Methanobrevibacter sp.]|nr:hypothetical protein [Methanobrevibacter sp.]